MPPEDYCERRGPRCVWGLLIGSCLTALAYGLLMALLWAVGIETIYGHPTPFYALWSPVGGWYAVGLTVLALGGMTAALLSRGVVVPYRLAAAILCAVLALLPGLLSLVFGATAYAVPLGTWLRGTLLHLPLLSVAVAGGLAMRAWLPGLLADAEAGQLAGKRLLHFLIAAFVFGALLACAVAAIRGGFHGISQAYARSAYEYAGDIGVTRSIRDLFSRYIEVRPYLSMHAKVHPPGPIALLWLMSYVVGRSALALSLATVVFGSLTVFPLYGWVKACFGARPALLAVVLYTVVPSVVLFTATSADILFLPFTVTTLYLFERALQGRSLRFGLAAGVGFALMSLLKFSLLAVGFYFAFRAIAHWLGDGQAARARFLDGTVTAAAMLAAALGVHALVYLWSGFDYVGALLAGKEQFDLDQYYLDELSPRWPAWTFRFWNPLTWFYFAGIPISLLYLWRLRWPGPHKAWMAVLTLTLLTLNLLYLARGEGERSALYLFPFLIAGATLALEPFLREGEPLRPLFAVTIFLVLQCWVTELLFYTYW